MVVYKEWRPWHALWMMRDRRQGERADDERGLGNSCAPARWTTRSRRNGLHLLGRLDHLASARVGAQWATKQQNVRLRAVPLIVRPAAALLHACNIQVDGMDPYRKQIGDEHANKKRQIKGRVQKMRVKWQ